MWNEHLVRLKEVQRCRKILFLMFYIVSTPIFAQRPSQSYGSGGGQTGGRLGGLGNFGTNPATNTQNPNDPKPRIRKENELFKEKIDTTRISIPDSLISGDNSIETTVKYFAEDSTIMDVDGKTVHLYGKAKVTYGEIELQADYIKLDWGKSEVYAHGMPDSTKKGEKVKGKPIFSQQGDKYDSDTMRYNFKSRKAIIKGIVTQQGEGFVQGKTVKKDPDDNLYLVHAKYTTCNLKEPHFHIAAKKIKLVNKKQVISGPFNFVLNNIPLPIGLPFGFFPVPKKKELGTSGFIMGTYGEEPNNRGFYFRDFGYYFAINEYIGMKFMGQIYSKGSYGLSAQSSYTKKYKYSGNLNLQFNHNRQGDEVIDGERKISNDFNISWSHSPANLRPDRSFSASVNLVSNGFNQNNRRTDELDLYTNNTFGSSVQFTRNLGKLVRSSAGFRVDQNVSTKVLNSSIDYSIGLNQFNPFVPEKKQAGNWYDSFRIGLDLSGGFRITNDVTSLTRSTTYTDYKVYGVRNEPYTDEELRQQALGRNTSVRTYSLIDSLDYILKNGQFRTTFSVPIALPNFKIAKFINFTPSISTRGEVFTQELDYTFYEKDATHTSKDGKTRVLKGIDEKYGAVVVDTLKGFRAAYQWSVGASMNTRVYGTYQFKRFGRLQAIRHTIAPSVGFGFSPDLTKRFFVETQVRNNDFLTDKDGNIIVNDKGEKEIRKLFLPKYPQLGSAAGASGSISLGITNQLEAKIKSKSDTATKAFDKISILDNFSLNTGYNLLADSMNLSDLSISANSQILKGLINLNFGANLDPYFYVKDDFSPAGRRTRFYKWQKADGVARLSNANISVSTRLTPQTFNKNKEPQKKESTSTDPAKEAVKKFVEANPLLYVDFSIPWSLNISYNLGYNRQGLTPTPQVVQALTLQGDLSLTPKWKFGFSTGWDFQYKAATLTNVSIHRELHCWDMSFNWTPIAGNNLRSSNFSFDLRARSTLLQELKLSRRRVYYDRGGF